MGKKHAYSGPLTLSLPRIVKVGAIPLRLKANLLAGGPPHPRYRPSPLLSRIPRLIGDIASSLDEIALPRTEKQLLLPFLSRVRACIIGSVRYTGVSALAKTPPLKRGISAMGVGSSAGHVSADMCYS